MNINYSQTQTERTGFLGLGGKQEVTRQKEMPVEEFFKETSKAIAGESDDSANRVYDQESINNALWNYADANGDGYIDEEEYSNLNYSIVTGQTNDTSSLAEKLGIGAIGAGLFGIPGAVLSMKLFSGENEGMTLEQAEAYMGLVEADKANNIDANGDGKLTRDEFDNAACNQILTQEDEDN